MGGANAVILPHRRTKASMSATNYLMRLLPASIFAIIPPSVLLAENNAPATATDTLKPSPRLSPEVVVRWQMNALSVPGPVDARIERCYRFASPENRKHTGPTKRFAAMIQAPKYAVLLDAKHFLVGQATVNGREAHLLLSVVDPQGNLSLFRCFLSKQTAAPYTDCWMTDAVMRVDEVNAPPNRRPPAQATPTI